MEKVVLKFQCSLKLNEAEEIYNLKKLALSVMEKSPEIVTNLIVCEAIKQGQKSARDTFTKNLSTEAVSVGVVIVAELICTKFFKQRFTGILMVACMTLVGC